jgi:hypothetical protein
VRESFSMTKIVEVLRNGFLTGSRFERHGYFFSLFGVLPSGCFTVR